MGVFEERWQFCRWIELTPTTAVPLPVSKEQILAKMQEFDALLQAAVSVRTELWSMITNMPDDVPITDLEINELCAGQEDNVNTIDNTGHQLPNKAVETDEERKKGLVQKHIEAKLKRKEELKLKQEREEKPIRKRLEEEWAQEEEVIRKRLEEEQKELDEEEQKEQERVQKHIEEERVAEQERMLKFIEKKKVLEEEQKQKREQELLLKQIEEQQKRENERKQEEKRKQIREREQAEINEFCTKYGSDVNAIDNDGKTLLHKAAEYDNGVDIAVVKFLISKGANVDAKDRNGYTPFDVAREGKKWNTAVIKYLASKMKHLTRETKNWHGIIDFGTSGYYSPQWEDIDDYDEGIYAYDD